MAGLPSFHELWNNIATGRPVFHSEQLIGGLDRRLDPTLIDTCNPLLFCLSALTLTPLWAWWADFAALALMILGMMGFQVLISTTRAAGWHTMPPWFGQFLTLGTVCSVLGLTIMASWLSYGTVIAALPWAVWALICPPSRTTWMVAAGCVIMVATTTPQLALTTIGYLVLLMLALSWAGHRISKAIGGFMVIGIGLLCLALILPSLLQPYLPQRLSGMGEAEPSTYVNGLGFLLAFATGIDPWGMAFQTDDSVAMGATITGTAIFTIIILALRNSFYSRLSLGIGVVTLIMLAMMFRQPAAEQCYASIPIIHSFRWPFRDGLFVLFSLHLLMLTIRPQWNRIATVTLITTSAVSSLAFLFGLILYPRAMTLNADNYSLPRYGVTSGMYRDIARDIRMHMEKDERLITVIHPKGTVGPVLFRTLPLLYEIPMATAYPGTTAAIIDGKPCPLGEGLHSPWDAAWIFQHRICITDSRIDGPFISVTTYTPRGTYSHQYDMRPYRSHTWLPMPSEGMADQTDKLDVTR